jgi:hypothetical protein
MRAMTSLRRIAVMACASGIAALFAAGSATADEGRYICTGDAKAAHGEAVSARLTVTRAGRVVVRDLDWSPPGAPGPGPYLTIGFPVGAAFGAQPHWDAPTGISFGPGGELPPPSVDTAWFELRADGRQVLRMAWDSFADDMRPLREPHEPGLMSSFGMTVTVWQGADQAAERKAAVDARVVEVRVAGSDGNAFSARAFDTGATGMRARLARRALARAYAAARRPRSRCMTAPPGL